MPWRVGRALLTSAHLNVGSVGGFRPLRSRPLACRLQPRETSRLAIHAYVRAARLATTTSSQISIPLHIAVRPLAAEERLCADTCGGQLLVSLDFHTGRGDNGSGRGGRVEAHTIWTRSLRLPHQGIAVTDPMSPASRRRGLCARRGNCTTTSRSEIVTRAVVSRKRRKT
jgi:hypothetical protein